MIQRINAKNYTADEKPTWMSGSLEITNGGKIVWLQGQSTKVEPAARVPVEAEGTAGQLAANGGTGETQLGLET